MKQKIIWIVAVMVIAGAGYYALSTRYEYDYNGWQRVDRWTGEVQRYHLGKYKSEEEYNQRLRRHKSEE